MSCGFWCKYIIVWSLHGRNVNNNSASKPRINERTGENFCDCVFEIENTLGVYVDNWVTVQWETLVWCVVQKSSRRERSMAKISISWPQSWRKSGYSVTEPSAETFDPTNRDSTFKCCWSGWFWNPHKKIGYDSFVCATCFTSSTWNTQPSHV